jgi:hypothetical protein
MVLADQDDWQPCFSALLLIGCWLVDILCPVLAKCYNYTRMIWKLVFLNRPQGFYFRQIVQSCFYQLKVIILMRGKVFNNLRKFGLVWGGFWIFEKFLVVPPLLVSLGYLWVPPLHLTKFFKTRFYRLKAILFMRGKVFDNSQKVWSSWRWILNFWKISCGPPLHLTTFFKTCFYWLTVIVLDQFDMVFECFWKISGGLPVLKVDFQSSHEAPHSSLRVHAWALLSNHNAKQLILIRCKHSQRAARSFVRGLEIRLKSRLSGNRLIN